MVYSTDISRENPTCLLFLIDHSGSMNDGWGRNPDKKKSEEVAMTLNRCIQNLVLKCAKDDGIRDYFHVGVIGYNNEHIGSALKNFDPERDLIPISELADNPLKIDSISTKVIDQDGNMIEEVVKVPIWVVPIAHGGTPMCACLQLAESIVAGWVTKHSTSFPPIVINITDGESTDGNPILPAQRIQKIKTTDGAALLFNIHVSSTISDPIMYPRDPDALPDDYARQLYAMSSHLPPTMYQFARSLGYTITDKTRGYGFNADISSFSDFLDIGTRPTNMKD
jgi:uncharacterized protein YegL